MMHSNYTQITSTTLRMEIAERLINGYVSTLWFITQLLWLFQTIVQQFELHMPMLLLLWHIIKHA